MVEKEQRLQLQKCLVPPLIDGLVRVLLMCQDRYASFYDAHHLHLFSELGNLEWVWATAMERIARKFLGQVLIVSAPRPYCRFSFSICESLR